nr:phage tail protein [Bacteroidales bacterium]
GAMQGDNEFFDWWNTHQLNTIERRDVIISLLNEKHEPVITWRVRNAFPVKVDGGSLKATGNEVSIETLEIAHEGITVER